MKEVYIVALLVLGAGLHAQEKTKNNFWSLGLFTRMEGAHNLYGANTKIPLPLSVTVLEFSIGAPRIYFYSQFRFSSSLSDSLNPKTVYYSPFPVHGRRLGFLVGIGGIFYNSRKGADSRGWTIHMNFGAGGEFALAKKHTLNVQFYPNFRAPRTYGLLPYYLIELNLMFKYYIYKHFGIQFGLNLSMLGTGLVSRRFVSEGGVAVFYHEEWDIRYGFSFGFMF